MKIRRFLIIVALFAGVLSSAFAADRYALVDISTAYVRSRPSHSGELVTQQFMGFPVKILAVEGEWYRVETIDGYKGYI
ncbi:MAG: SH3 domain-containing protein [Muribaculaceae bacterium]|nr:SH3 domain-containing protein [Muribaculaceae bacterium]